MWWLGNSGLERRGNPPHVTRNLNYARGANSGVQGGRGKPAEKAGDLTGCRKKEGQCRMGQLYQSKKPDAKGHSDCGHGGAHSVQEGEAKETGGTVQGQKEEGESCCANSKGGK